MKKAGRYVTNVKKGGIEVGRVNVYVAEIPACLKVGDVYPPLRDEEIKAVKNVALQREKYCVWKLLEYAINHSFEKEIGELSFWKCDTGKWSCDLCEFSLSHAHHAVCVAVSLQPVGVDIEEIKRTKTDVSSFVFSADELKEYQGLADEKKVLYLIDTWTKKESLFKLKNVKLLTREEFKRLDGGVQQKTLFLADGEYSLSVATDEPSSVCFYNADLNWNDDCKSVELMDKW